MSADIFKTAKLEKPLGRVPRKTLEKFVLEQGRKNEEFGYQLRSWLNQEYTQPEEKDESYYQSVVRDAVDRTIELCRRGSRRGGAFEERQFPMPALLDEVEQEFRRAIPPVWSGWRWSFSDCW